jgi:8-oxo-dGTP pyrophosphatase MutT (NUDIX family)
MTQTSAAVLILDNHKLVFQRRDSLAPAAPNLLGLFGGHFEDSETPEQALQRELQEETSLDLKKLDFKYLFFVDYPDKVRTHVFVTHITSEHFKVFEGSGEEVYSFDDVLKRKDLEPDTRVILERIKSDGHTIYN